MDCNKEEAMRAREIAEKKMENKDFLVARKIALKAQQLYPDVENISQMLMVCDVHCSAAKKIAGNEMDWYGILQVEEKADEATIKKQYRKFALQLHPDKNKFSGAEAAFKLIGEAQRILLDKEKRMLHNARRQSSFGRPPTTNFPSHRATSTSNVVLNNYRSGSGLNSQNQQPQQPAYQVNPDPHSTFWTTCPFCTVKYQYYKEVVNRSLRCQNCQKPFVAYDLNAPAAADFSKPVFPQQKNNGQKVGAQSQQNVGTRNSKAESVQNAGKKVDTSGVGTPKVNRKRERKCVRDRSKLSDSEMSDSEISTDSEEDVSIDENGDIKSDLDTGYSGERNPRRSSRHKQQVSYKENLSDDDHYTSPSKRSKGKTSSCVAEGANGDPSKEESAQMKNMFHFDSNIKEDEKGIKQKEADEECVLNGAKSKKSEENKEPVGGDGFKRSFEGHNNVDSSLEDASDLAFVNYPDPDFNDFDKGRKAEHFAAGQIWAAYDVLNAMPRFYARIKKVLSPGFKLQITWLEPDPKDENEIKWNSGELPFSCGKFKYGNSEKTENRLIFSHLVTWEKDSIRDTFIIYPRKGETWALFQNWDIRWSCDPAGHRQSEYEYEFVEILSDYAADVGIHVALLSKVKGFVSVFRRMEKLGKKTFLVPPGELLRFSHMIPSYKMKGDERGVPPGSFELDPAALPIKALTESGSDMNRNHLEPQQNSSAVPPSSLEELEIPEPDFHNFDADKSNEKFQIGQIWALYSDEDGLPKYYGQIKKIEYHPSFKLHIWWLYSSSLPSSFVRWSDDDMPITCGKFKLVRGDSQIYDSIGSFSHLVNAVSTERRHEYEILPRKGEIWALYRNWNPKIKCSDLENCEYDIVEVLSATALLIQVLVLDRVDGFSSVFKARVQGGSIVSWSIPQIDFLKFSHQIPAFRLTEEGGGKLRGFWELDTAALPVHYFCST